MNTLYTFGYHKAMLREFATWVIRSGAIVVDTRFTAWSKHEDWREHTIRQALPSGQYGRMQSLGNVNYKGGAIQIADADAGVPVVVGLLERAPVLLLCGCANVETCHRKVVAELIVAACGAPVVHLSLVDVMGKRGRDGKRNTTD